MDHSIEKIVREAIREVPDFPKPGILFYDITTVMLSGDIFHKIVHVLLQRYESVELDAIVGIEARGFIFGACVAYALHKPFVPVRKPGKLPAATEEISYALEYGEGKLELHRDALTRGQKVAVIDDLLATGGTAKASVDLIERIGARVVECAFLVELTSLGGREKLAPTPVVSLVKYEA